MNLFHIFTLGLIVFIESAFISFILWVKPADNDARTPLQILKALIMVVGILIPIAFAVLVKYKY